MLPKKAFTLIEMLVVVTIIGLLVSLMMPAIGRARELSKRASCANNLQVLVKACLTYAISTSNQGDTPKALPVAGGKLLGGIEITKDNWYNFKDGNRRCLWLLVAGEYATAEHFVCPSSNFRTAQISEGFFGLDPVSHRDSCSYSYISMVNPTGTNRPPISMIAGNSIAGLVIMADLNTRFDPGDNSVVAGSNNGYFGNNHNSRIHNKGEGQNIGRIDGSATWNDTGIVTTGAIDDDKIYEPTGTGSDAEGRAGGADDVFLLP